MNREELLQSARKLYENPGTNDDLKVILEKTYPELKESEDERIRKSIIHLLQMGGYMSPEDKTKAFAWLEKQKSIQSDTEKQYVRTLESLISDFLHGKQEVDRDYYQQICNWLEGRHIEEKPVEWSEEDEEMIDYIIHALSNSTCVKEEGPAIYTKEINWLKSLRPYPHWKPSEEQMKAILDAMIPATGNTLVYLNSLYEQLKAL